LGVVTFNASAVLVDNGDFTTDTRTGLDWLDITQTGGASYNDVTAQLGVGGLFEGWVYASSTQVSEFFTSAGGTAPYNGYSTVNNGVVAPLVDLWGITDTVRSIGLTPFIQFITAEESPNFANEHNTGLIEPADDLEDRMDILRSFVPDDTNEPLLGSALVRNTAVPVPGAIWLLGSGFLGLIGIARRRKVA